MNISVEKNVNWLDPLQLKMMNSFDYVVIITSYIICSNLWVDLLSYSIKFDF